MTISLTDLTAFDNLIQYLPWTMQPASRACPEKVSSWDTPPNWILAEFSGLSHPLLVPGSRVAQKQQKWIEMICSFFPRTALVKKRSKQECINMHNMLSPGPVGAAGSGLRNARPCWGNWCHRCPCFLAYPYTSSSCSIVMHAAWFRYSEVGREFFESPFWEDLSRHRSKSEGKLARISAVFFSE